jgi:RNase II-type exonuclease C-terminal S1 domain
VIDLAETVMLGGQVGQSFAAIVTDVTERDLRIQLRDFPVVARVSGQGAAPGDALTVRLTAADPDKRRLAFERVA